MVAPPTNGPALRRSAAAVPLTFALATFASSALGPARAHLGSVVANAKFCLPPAPEPLLDGDGGAPRYRYTPEEADRRYRIAWDDGDNDPTARLTLYYFDRQFPSRVVATEIEAEGHIVRMVGGGEARNIYVSCACTAEDGGAAACLTDASAACFDGGPRWCDSAVEWDTSDVPDGAYWIAAVNDDPPYHLYSVSAAPVRVSHGGRPPPVIIVVKPDGADPAADATYLISLLVVANGPVTLDLSYGRNTSLGVGDPLLPIVRGVVASVADDGLVHYTWDTSAVTPGMYFVEATVTDEAGLRTTTRSRQAASISRRPAIRDAGAADAGEVAPARSCSCRAGRRTDPRPALLASALLSLVIGARARRRIGRAPR